MGVAKVVGPMLLVGLGIGAVGTATSAASRAPTPPPTTGEISGTVVNVAGQPVDGVTVTASDNTGAIGAATNADGTYTISLVDPGKYVVQFDPPASSYLVLQLYKGVTGYQWTKAKPVRVKPGKDTSGVNATLATGGAITVLVQDSSGDPLSGAGVCPVFHGSKAVAGLCGVTNASGIATTGAMPDGNGKVEVEGGYDGLYRAFYAPGTYSFKKAQVLDVQSGTTVSATITIPPSD